MNDKTHSTEEILHILCRPPTHPAGPSPTNLRAHQKYRKFKRLFQIITTPRQLHPQGGTAAQDRAALLANAHGLVGAGQLVVDGLFAGNYFNAGLGAGDHGVVGISHGQDGRDNIGDLVRQ